MTTKNNKQDLGNFRHAKFEIVKDAIKAKNPVFLFGEAGTGKNHMVEQIAADMELPFNFTNAVIETQKLQGMQDGLGICHASGFYET